MKKTTNTTSRLCLYNRSIYSTLLIYLSIILLSSSVSAMEYKQDECEQQAHETFIHQDEVPPDDNDFNTAGSINGNNYQGKIVNNFSASTLSGSFNLAKHWQGCNSYIIITHYNDTNGNKLFDSLSADFFKRSSRNAHYLFASQQKAPENFMQNFKGKVQQQLSKLSVKEQAYWNSRIHYLIEPVTEINGSLGRIYSSLTKKVRVVAIDRYQRWDQGGNYHDTTPGYFTPDMNVLAYLSKYYDAQLHQSLQYDDEDKIEEVTLVKMMDKVIFKPDCTPDEACYNKKHGPFSNKNNNKIWPVNFPEAESMKDFDTLEFDLTANCGPDRKLDCGRWDYEAYIQLCNDIACTEQHEIIRWITPYSRPGKKRWLFNLSPFIGLLKTGGTHYFKFGMLWNMNPATYSMTFRLSHTDKEQSSSQVIKSFSGNHGFNASYNEHWQPQFFTPPAGTEKVELVSIISGHGQVGTDYCAEWCNHQHQFRVNDENSYLREFPGQVIEQGCASQVNLGVVPGQWGNWTPGRAGWCPGQTVKPWIVDITDSVNMGVVNTLNYKGMYQNGTPQGGRIRLNSYLVYYSDD